MVISLRRTAWLALLGAVYAASPSSAQQVSGTVRLHVRPVLMLETGVGSAAAEESAGKYVELAGAVRVRVSANVGWELAVGTRSPEPEGAARAGTGGAGVLHVRTCAYAVAGRCDGEWIPVGHGRTVVMTGGPGGGQPVLMDVRWREAPAASISTVLDALALELVEQ